MSTAFKYIVFLCLCIAAGYNAQATTYKPACLLSSQQLKNAIAHPNHILPAGKSHVRKDDIATFEDDDDDGQESISKHVMAARYCARLSDWFITIEQPYTASLQLAAGKPLHHTGVCKYIAQRVLRL